MEESSSSSSSHYQFGDKDQQLLQQYLQQHESQRYPRSTIPKPPLQLTFTHQQCQLIRAQVQFYLSPANLLDDIHMKKQLSKNKDKWLNISYLIKCNRINKMLKEGYLSKQSNGEIELIVKGQSTRAKVRCLGKILQKSEGLIVRGNKVRSRSQIFHREIKKGKKKQGIDEQKRDEVKEEKGGMSRRQLSRMLYVEIDSDNNFQELIAGVNKIEKVYNETQMIEIQQPRQKAEGKKQRVSFKSSQISKRWLLIHCKTLKFREYLQKQVQQSLPFVVKLIDGFAWTKEEQKYKIVKSKITKYVP